MSLVLQSTGGGSVTINEPTTASNFTVTLPAAAGEVMVSGNQPAFSAYAAGTTSLSNTTWTKITLGTEEFDTNNNFASNRFTPTVAGYYQISAQVQMGLATHPVGVDIYKNGGATGYVLGGFQSGALNANTGISKLLYLNGSTDYVEVYAYQASGSTQTTVAGNVTQMSGCLVRAA